MRKKDEKIRENLLACARSLAKSEGPEALSIRAIAKRAGVATGTVYNYFQSKNDILLTLTEEYWRNTLIQLRGAVHAEGFPEQLEEIYGFLSAHISHLAGRLMGSLRGAEGTGRARMCQMQAVLCDYITELLRQAPKLRQGLWDETFTEEAYADFVVMNLVVLLGSAEPNIHFFTELTRRTLYPEGEK